jgi:oligosaccharyltransferase complex subunit beta
MDPFIRMPFKNEGGGVLSATFMVPDQYGVFNFIVKFNKLGYTKIEHKQQITVRPLRHDMYERFILCAYPYYFSAFSMMFGVFILSFAVLYHKDPKTKAE